MKEELTTLQVKILSTMIFVETFDHILEEVKAPEKIVRADMRMLIDRRYIQVMERDGDNYRRTVFYDADDMRAYYYTATEKALSLYGGKGRK